MPNARLMGPGRMTPQPQDLTDPNTFAAMQPKGLTETVAKGGAALDQGTQDIINQELARANTNDTGQLMRGVNESGQGLIRNQQGGNSLGMSTPSDFYSTMEQRGREAVANTSSEIERNLQLTNPLRRSNDLALAAGNLAKSETLRYNNWVLKNKQNLQALQLKQAQEAASSGFLGSILGLVGAAGAVALTIGTAGAAAPLTVPMIAGAAGAGLGVGQAAGGAINAATH